MDVRLSSEQQALRSTAAKVVDRLGPRAVADLDDPERAARLRAAVEESGWLELRDPGEAGAPQATGVELSIVAEELGRGLADAAFIGPILASDLRRRAHAESSPFPETVVLDRSMSTLAQSGTPDGVAVDAEGLSAALVLAGDRSAGGRGLAAVELLQGGVQSDLTRRTAGTDVDVAAVDVTGGRFLDDEDLSGWMALGLALTCADLVGVMRGAIELARDYAVTRRQYGAPIGSFQAVQHLLADAHVAMEGSRSVALHAAWAVDAMVAPEALAAAALAKAYCARAARTVCETVVQVHGGIGNTWDCLAHLFLRRALLSIELFGGADASVERVLAHRGIGEGAAAGSGSGHGLR